jgi:TPR repeat protein
MEPRHIPEYVFDAFENQDFDLVLKLAMPRALAGDSDAQTTIALLYQCGLGVTRDVLEAERWLLKAAEQDNPVAWHNLGTLYAEKFPESKDKWARAYDCYEKAKALGLNVAHPYPPSSN